MNIISVTVVLFSFEAAHFTLNSATPDKFAVAFFFDVANHSLVASSTTKKPASIDSIAGAVAETPSSSQNSYPVNKKNKFKD